MNGERKYECLFAFFVIVIVDVVKIIHFIKFLILIEP